MAVVFVTRKRSPHRGSLKYCRHPAYYFINFYVSKRKNALKCFTTWFNFSSYTLHISWSNINFVLFFYSIYGSIFFLFLFMDYEDKEMNRELARENWDAWSPKFMEIWYSGNYFAPISTLEPLNSSFTLKFVRSLTWGNMTPELWRLWTRIKFRVTLLSKCVFQNVVWRFQKYTRVQPEGWRERFASIRILSEPEPFFVFFFSFFCFYPLPDDPMRASVFRNWELICVARTFFPPKKEKNIPTLLFQMMCGLRDKGQKLF